MKKLLLLLLIVPFWICSNGQSTITVYSDKSVIDLKEEVPLYSQFLDSLFYQGKVYFKNGKSTSALMNYNLLANGIVFVDKNQKILILDGLKEISFVTYNKRVFFPNRETVLEQIDSYSNNVLLLLKRKSTIDQTMPGPYGRKVASSDINKLSSISGSTISSYSEGYIKNEKEITVVFETSYFLKINEKVHTISKIKDLKKLFPLKKDLLLNFISDNKLNINNVNDLKRLVKFCAEDK